MKINVKTLVSLLWCLSLSKAGVIELTIHKRVASHPDLHSTYIYLLNGNIVKLLVEGYEGEVTELTINTTFVPKYHYANTKELAISNTDLVARADVCLYITDCVGLLKDYTAFYGVKGANGLASWCISATSAFSNYFTANDNANAVAVLNGAISSVALVVPLMIAT
jgi:hypothetical protein